MDYSTLKKLVAIDSPSGYTEEASQYIFDLLKSYGWKPERKRTRAIRAAAATRARPSVCRGVN